MAARFTLHGHWLSGPSNKVGLFLALSGEPFAYHHVDLATGAHKSPGYVAQHRYGQVPLLVDEQNGRRLVQSAAILEYLADVTGRFGGANLDERIAAREWMFWEFDRLSRGVFRPRAVRAGIFALPPDVLAHYEAEGRAGLKVLDDHLAGRPFIVGEGPTIADIDIFGVAFYAPDAGHDLGAFPNLSGWMKRIAALPGYRAPGEVLPKATLAA